MIRRPGIITSLTLKLASVPCASQNDVSAIEKAQANGLRHSGVQELLAATDIDIVLILTPSPTHARLATAALEAGKHVYMEKTIAGSIEEARLLLDLADSRALRVGVAPDTVFGAAVQLGRELIEEGKLGDVILGTAAGFSHGMEGWHPNPAPFYSAEVGPVMDIGPYLLTTLVTLLGPVRKVTSTRRMGNRSRSILSDSAPNKGACFTPEVATSFLATLEFGSGTILNLMLSWDVWQHGQPFFELHGTQSSLRLPHYNWFGGDVMISHAGSEWQHLSTADRRLGTPNWHSRKGLVANYRGIGLAEMANAIDNDRPHRAGGDLALHVLEVILAIQGTESDTETHSIRSSFASPLPLSEQDSLALF
jgi:predicted dehydrogenase